MGIPGGDGTETVRDSVDVGVDADAGFLVTLCDNKVCRLPADPFDGKQFIDRIRDFAFDTFPGLYGKHC